MTKLRTSAACCLFLSLCAVLPSAAKTLGCVSRPSDEVGHWAETEMSAHDFHAVDHHDQHQPAGAQLWPDQDGNTHVIFSRPILKPGNYIAETRYVNGIPICLDIVLSARAISPTELVLDTLGAVHFYRSSPFFVVDIPKTGLRLRVGSGTWP